MSPTIRLPRPPAPAPATTPMTRLVDAGRAEVPMAAVQGTLALDLGLPVPRTAPPEPPTLQLVHYAGANREIQAWAARFAQALVEVVGGDRPLAQLLRWTSAPVYDQLNRRVRILARTSPASDRMRTVRPQVHSVHVFQPGPDAAEVSVHVRHGRRSRALAARMERREGRWRCTALQLG